MVRPLCPGPMTLEAGDGRKHTPALERGMGGDSPLVPGGNRGKPVGAEEARGHGRLGLQGCPLAPRGGRRSPSATFETGGDGSTSFEKGPRIRGNGWDTRGPMEDEINQGGIFASTPCQIAGSHCNGWCRENRKKECIDGLSPVSTHNSKHIYLTSTRKFVLKAELAASELKNTTMTGYRAPWGDYIQGMTR